MEAHGSYNKVEGESLVQKYLLKNLTEEEHLTDEDTDAVPPDHVHYLHRVSGGVLGSAEDVINRHVVKAQPDSYIYGEYAVLASEIDVDLLAERGVGELAESEGSDASTDLGSDELSDDEAESIATLNVLRRSMRAAAEREDCFMAAGLQ